MSMSLEFIIGETGNLFKFASIKIRLSFTSTNFYKHSLLTTPQNILAVAKRTILIESQAIAGLIPLLSDSFADSVKLIHESRGRLVVTGIGKSAIIAQKIVATMNSTGTPSIFLHAAEAVHGDLGMVQPGDVVICISKSGNSPEIKLLVPLIKRFGNPLIGMTGNVSSFLAKQSDFVLNTTVPAEADPINLAPTNSTTAQLVMGDALAVCLMELRGFTPDHFAKYHPGGALGKRLLLRVADMLDQSQRPSVGPQSSIKEAIVSISAGRLGVTAVVEGENLVGIVTDGDIRRMLNDRDTFTDLVASDIMTKNPKTVAPSDLVVSAFNLMEDFKITQVLVVDDGRYVGVLHLHDILKEGIL